MKIHVRVRNKGLELLELANSMRRKIRKVTSRPLDGTTISIGEISNLLLQKPIEVRPSTRYRSLSLNALPNEVTLDIRQAHVLLLKEVVVFPEFSIAHDQSGRIIEETAFSQGRLSALLDRKQLRTYPIIRTRHPFTVIESGWYNYYHWLIDDLSRLTSLRLLDVDEFPQVLVFLTRRISHEMLAILRAALPSNFQIRFAPRGSRIAGPAYIHLPSRAESEAAILDSATCRQLKEWCHTSDRDSDVLRNHNERLYISRAKASKRRFSNESEVIELLTRFKFKTCFLEEMTIGEQVNIFKQARYVVAQHGAGLSNLVFTTQLEYLLEIHSAQAHHHYRWLAHELGIDYSSIMVQSTDYNGDIEAPIDEIRDWLHRVLSENY